MPPENDPSATQRRVAVDDYVEIGVAWKRFTGRATDGDGWKPLVHPDDLSRVERDWGLAQKSGRFSSEYRVIAKDGRYHRILFVAIRIMRCGAEPCWYGKITEMDADHRHVCTTSVCFCGLRRPE